MFMDKVIFTVTLDSNNKVIDVISHNQNVLDTKKIKTLATKILKQKNIKNIYVGNLYLNRYSYFYDQNNQIIIIDNNDVKNELISTLNTSLLIFVIFQTIIILLSFYITKWIAKPVEESFNRQKEFTENASHELKTPLAVIMASADALEKDNDKKWLFNIQNEAERMNKLIINLLTLSKMDNAIYNVAFKEENLSKITEMSILPFESLIFEKNIKLKYDLQSKVMFNCNIDEIKELVGILLDNAIKHTNKKGNIYILLKEEKSNIILSVTNDGEGINKEDEEKIFERFYRNDKSRNRNENRFGLGLAIAKSIVTNHNGKIFAKSDNGKTVFEVVFKK